MSVPAAPLRGFVSGLSGGASLYALQTERSMTASPRTSTRPGASISCGSPGMTQRAFSVTSSPSVPVPRVAT